MYNIGSGRGFGHGSDGVPVSGGVERGITQRATSQPTTRAGGVGVSFSVSLRCLCRRRYATRVFFLFLLSLSRPACCAACTATPRHAMPLACACACAAHIHSLYDATLLLRLLRYVARCRTIPRVYVIALSLPCVIEGEASSKDLDLYSKYHDCPRNFVFRTYCSSVCVGSSTRAHDISPCIV